VAVWATIFLRPIAVFSLAVLLRTLCEESAPDTDFVRSFWRSYSFKVFGLFFFLSMPGWLTEACGSDVRTNDKHAFRCGSENVLAVFPMDGRQQIFVLESHGISRLHPSD
jgi:hypothetical protein